MTQQDIINQFLTTISWGDATRTITDDLGTWLECGIYSLYPCMVSEYLNSRRNIQEAARRSESGRAGVILAGDCSAYDFDQVNWDTHNCDIVAYWLHVNNRLRYGRFVRQITDGLDLRRLIQEAMAEHE